MCPDAIFLVFWMLSCKPAFSFSSFTFISSVQLLSRVWLCNPMDCSMPGSPVHHQLPGLAQTHVPRVGDTIQPSYPLSFPFPPAFNLSQHQGLFQWVSSSHQLGGQSIGGSVSASILPMNIQGWFPLGNFLPFRLDKWLKEWIIFSFFLTYKSKNTLWDTLLLSPCSLKGDKRCQ